jgi:hypothetical protein
LKDALAKHYGNAIIPELFKNLTKCKELAEKCRKHENEPDRQGDLPQPQAPPPA